MKEKLKKLAPPGLNLGPEYGLFFAGGLIAALIACVRFLDRFGSARSNLYDWIGREKVLIHGAVMPPLGELIGDAFQWFLVAAAALLAVVLWHYLSYRQGSMSVYLMRRLPDKNLIHRQCWTLPVLGVILYILAVLVLTAVFYLTYRFGVPAQCLPADLWR